MKRLFLSVLLLLLAACSDGGDPAPEPRTVTFPIASAHTGQTYDITVSLPVGYDKTATRSPVIYALDGTDRLTRLAEPLRRQKYDNVIMVGISANGGGRRFIDFTMPGAEAYNRFVTAELIPKIDAEYHTDPAMRVLTGHSLSAEFALFSLFMEPVASRTFRAYVVNDCSCWIDSTGAFVPDWTVPIQMLEGLYARNPVLPVKVWMGSSNGMLPPAIYQRLSMRGFQGLEARHTPFPQDTAGMDAASFAESLVFSLGPPQP